MKVMFYSLGRLCGMAVLILGMSSAAWPCTSLVYPLQREDDPNTSLYDRSLNDNGRYILHGFVGGDLGALRDDGATPAVDCERLAPLARKILGNEAPRGTLTLDGLRDAWQAYAIAARLGLGYGDKLPATWEAFQQVTHYRQWDGVTVERSRIKQAKRVIFRSPEGFVPRMSVAETHKGDVTDDSVRETEVAVERLDGSGHWDFYVYARSGALAPESEFPNGMQPAPVFCVSCHYDVMTRRVDRFFPRLP